MSRFCWKVHQFQVCPLPPSLLSFFCHYYAIFGPLAVVLLGQINSWTVYSCQLHSWSIDHTWAAHKWFVRTSKKAEKHVYLQPPYMLHPIGPIKHRYRRIHQTDSLSLRQFLMDLKFHSVFLLTEKYGNRYIAKPCFIHNRRLRNIFSCARYLICIGRCFTSRLVTCKMLVFINCKMNRQHSLVLQLMVSNWLRLLDIFYCL